MRKTFYIATFGCRTNQADSSAIRQKLLDAGYQETVSYRSAGLVLLNSCTVTQRTDQQVRQFARKIRRENADSRLILTGCYAQRNPHQLLELGVFDAIVGNTHKEDLVQINEDLSLSPAYNDIAAVYRDDFSNLRAFDLAPSTSTGGRTRPFVKIQDGCSAACTYCIIPSVRGPSRSVPPDQILSHVRSLIAAGFREIVLTGIHIGTYGVHFHPRYYLDELLREIIELPGLGQVRISSMEPMELSRRVIDLAARSDAIAPHFHICLQSGSDRVLQRMRRPYRVNKFASIVSEIRCRIPEAGIGTDVIVGFPGETDEDHRQTVQFIQAMPFTYVHVFPYSDRNGTPASGMPGKISPHIIRKRAAEIRSLSASKNRAFRQQFLHRRIKVLTLSEKIDGKRRALSGNYLKTKLDSSIPGNRIVEGRVASVEGDHLILEEPVMIDSKPPVENPSELEDKSSQTRVATS